MNLSQGIGLVKISRIEAAIKRQRKRFLDRVFSPSEQAYCSSKRMACEHYAARLAAKEAFLKAAGIGSKKGTALRGIEVLHERTGKPKLLLSPAIRKVAALGPAAQTELSIAHEREYAVATVVILRP